MLTNNVNFHKIRCMKYSAIKILGIIFVNLITLGRLFGSFIVPFIYVNNGIDVAATWTICLFLTDAIDGFLARRFKVSTFFGCAMDALSDKLLNAVSFILLSFNYNIMIPPLIVEIAILFTIYSTYRFGGNVQTSATGKIKTIILDVCVVISYLLLSISNLHTSNIILVFLIENTHYIISILGCIITITSIITLIDYNKKYKLVRSNPELIHVKKQNRTKKSFSEILSNAFDTEYYSKHKNEPIMAQLYK